MSTSEALPADRAISQIDEVTNYNRPRSIAAMIAVTNPGSFTMIVAPLLLSAFVRGGLTPAQTSMLCSAELAGMTAASLVAALFVARFRRILIAAGLAAALFGHGVSIAVSDFAIMLSARAIAGFGIGMMFTTAVAGLAGLATPSARSASR